MSDPDPARAAPAFGTELYAPWRASEVGRITDLLEHGLILELAGEVAGKRVLDVGCGDGELALALREKGAEVVGVDRSERMIESAVARAGGQDKALAFAVAGAEGLPFADSSFDMVTAITVLCFVADAAPVFAEMARVLRPEGRLVIGELGRWSTWAAQRRLRGWLGSPLWRAARFRTPGELERLAAGAGLVPETVRGAVFYPRWALAARAFAPFDPALGRRTTLGAAFLALAAVKPKSD